MTFAARHDFAQDALFVKSKDGHRVCLQLASMLVGVVLTVARSSRPRAIQAMTRSS